MLNCAWLQLIQAAIYGELRGARNSKAKLMSTSVEGSPYDVGNQKASSNVVSEIRSGWVPRSVENTGYIRVILQQERIKHGEAGGSTQSTAYAHCLKGRRDLRGCWVGSCQCIASTLEGSRYLYLRQVEV